MRLFIALLFSCYPLLGATAGDAAAGEFMYSSCSACHGANAQGNKAMAAPGLNHLGPEYIAAQLQKFRSGVRGGAGSSATAMQMAPMAALLADDDAVQSVALYISDLPNTAAVSSATGDIGLGADYYNQFCGACHGADAQGNLALNSPRLSGGSDWYLEAQLLAFRAGTRGSHLDDRTGRQMQAMAAVLPNEQAVQDVVAFISSL